MKEYVSYQEEVYRIAGTRISLDSIVYAFLNGETAETIAQSFPLLTLEQVYGAIAYYLASRTTIDAYLSKGRLEYEAMRKASRAANPKLYSKLSEKRHSQVNNI